MWYKTTLSPPGERGSFEMSKYIIPLCMAALAALTLPAQAEKCSLPQIASLGLKPIVNGDYAVPVSVGGAEHSFLLGLNNPFSVISGTLADAQGYKTVNLPKDLRPQLNGEQMDRKVIVADVAIGLSHGKDFQMLRSDTATAKLGVDGVAALDLLQNFDVELDLAAGKLNLFSPNDCERKIYWSPSYAEVPFKTDKSGHTEFAMRLDDQKVTVDFEVSDGNAVMGTNTLKRLFGLTPQSPGMVAETQGGETVWHYPFKTLAIDGIVINNPHITIRQDDGMECRSNWRDVGGRPVRCYGSSELHLRTGTLKALHLYFDFKDKTLYATAAGAKLPAPEPVK
jgi:hypothetical protein